MDRSRVCYNKGCTKNQTMRKIMDTILTLSRQHIENYIITLSNNIKAKCGSTKIFYKHLNY